MLWGRCFEVGFFRRLCHDVPGEVINAIGRNFSVNSSDTTLGLYPEAVEILLDLGDGRVKIILD